MTTKHLSGDYPNGYTLSANYSKLVIGKNAYVGSQDGGGGVYAPAFATVVNHGTIFSYGEGVVLEAGGALINGSATNTGASITGSFGYAVTAQDAAAVANFGTIAALGYYGDGVNLYGGGSLTNGSTRDTTALISGYSGVEAFGVNATIIANFGTIAASRGAHYGAIGVIMTAGGSLTNGSTHDVSALIFGLYGVAIEGADTVVNFGTIKGYTGVSVYGDGATITNFGTIKGTNGASVKLRGVGDELIAEAGATFIGKLEGGGGRLVLAGGGTGTISGLGGGGTLTGAVDVDFRHFDSIVIGAGGSWTLMGPSKVDADTGLVDEGTLINTGALTVSGTVSIEASAVFSLAGGNISAGATGAARIVDDGLMIKSADTGKITVGARLFDSGVVEVATGMLDVTSRLFGTGALKIDGGATLEADAAAVSTLTLTFGGPASTLALKSPKVFDATLGGFAAEDVIDLLAIEATGASVNASDQLVIVDGAKTVASLQLSGNYAGAAFTTGSDGHGGTNIELAPAQGAHLPSVQRMAAAMAAMAAPACVAARAHDPGGTRGPTLAHPVTQAQ